jgi:O-acetyl-ADP-ribose deacetylase (regulator of RNase III)
MPGGGLEKRGFSALFVGPVPSELECPVCLLVMREPHLTSCCGNHFCFSCISEVREDGKPCPLCKVVITHTLLNRKEKCRILELRVYCNLKDKGCPWTGELCDLEYHVQSTKDKGPCEYVEIQCSLGCGRTMERRHVQLHLESDCPLRLQTCSYCDHKATGKDLAEHFETCPKYPVICPHLCELSAVPRCELSSHLDICPNQPVDCPFKKVNCTVQLTRKELKSHIDLYLQNHLEMVVERLVTVETRNRDLEDRLAQYEKRTSHLEEKLVMATGEDKEEDWVSVPDPNEEEVLVEERVEEEASVEHADHQEGEDTGSDVLSSPSRRWLSTSVSCPQDLQKTSSPSRWSSGGQAGNSPSSHRRIHTAMTSWFNRYHEHHPQRRHWFSRRPVQASPPYPDNSRDNHPQATTTVPTKPPKKALSQPPSTILSQLRESRGIYTIVLKPGCPTVQLKRGNIVSELVECVAAPSDPLLWHDGGCIGMINMASKGVLQNLSKKYVHTHGKLSPGDAVSFDMGGSLHAKYVICVVGPHAKQFSSKRATAILHTACTAVLNLAVELKVSSLAIPSISAGAYGMDPEVVAQVIVDTCLEHPYPDECSLTDIRLVIYDPMVYKRFEEYFVQRKRELEASLEETGLTPEGRKRANT